MHFAICCNSGVEPQLKQQNKAEGSLPTQLHPEAQDESQMHFGHNIFLLEIEMDEDLHYIVGEHTH